MNAPPSQGLHISGAKSRFRLTVGDTDLSHLLIHTRGPIIETLVQGADFATGRVPPLRCAWIPVLFEGDVDDPDGMCRIVHEGEAESVGLPSVRHAYPEPLVEEMRLAAGRSLQPGHREVR